MSALRVSLRILGTVLWLPIIFFPLLLSWTLRLHRLNRCASQLAFRVGCYLWGVRVRLEGQLAQERPLLLVSNHFSYLDVFAIGGYLPVRFTPKKDIASWPVIGFLTTINGALYIDRRPSRTLENKAMLAEMSAHKEIISLFPEGTTNDGTQVLAFKSAFFSLAEHHGIAVQPLSIRYDALDGKPLDALTREHVGWYGDAFFFPHVLRYLGHKHVDVTLILHPALHGKDFASRKALAMHCHEIISRAL